MPNLDSLPTEISSGIFSIIADSSLYNISLLSKKLRVIIDNDKDYIIKQYYKNNTSKCEFFQYFSEDVGYNSVLRKIFKDANIGINGLYPYANYNFFVYFQGSIVEINNKSYPIGDFKLVLIYLTTSMRDITVRYIDGTFQRKYGHLYPQLHSDFSMAYYDISIRSLFQTMFDDDNVLIPFYNEWSIMVKSKPMGELSQFPLIERIISFNKNLWPYKDYVKDNNYKCWNSKCE